MKNMEANEKKPLSGLYEEMKRIRNLPLDPKAVEEFNELRRKDEELENQKQDQQKKIARDPEAEA